jgi:hypothetical protein|tara:strand:- start:639 stop:968 length:330 start_codon:yes stop_codon:yes gene_type:complete
MKQIDKVKLPVLVVIARYDIMISIKEAIELLNFIDIDNDTKIKTIRELKLTKTLHPFWRVIRQTHEVNDSRNYHSILKNLREMKEYIEANEEEYFEISKPIDWDLQTYL